MMISTAMPPRRARPFASFASAGCAGLRRVALGLAAVLSVLFAPVAAQDEGADPRPGPVVVELFSSQGCSSCPPADAMLGELATREGVIALALHVDYWDYIGWEDTFADPVFTARQYGYGHAAGSTMVYTPQIVINGIDHVAGYRPMQFMDLLAAHREVVHPVGVEAEADAETVTVAAIWRGPGAPPAMVVQLVTVSPEETVDIRNGENAGRVVKYHNVARSLEVLAEWDGQRPFRAELPPTGPLSFAVIVQQVGSGPILGAAWVE